MTGRNGFYGKIDELVAPMRVLFFAVYDPMTLSSKWLIPGLPTKSPRMLTPMSGLCYNGSS